MSKENEKRALASTIVGALNTDQDNPIKDHLIKAQAHENAKKNYAKMKVDNNESLKLVKTGAAASPIAMGGLAAIGALPGLTVSGAVASSLPVSAPVLAGAYVAHYAMRRRNENKFEGSREQRDFERSYNHDRQKVIVSDQLEKFRKTLEKGGKKAAQAINDLDTKKTYTVGKIQKAKRKMEQNNQENTISKNRTFGMP